MDQTRLSSNPFSESLKRFKRRRGYNGFYGRRKNMMRSVRLGDGSPQWSWRIKAAAPKLRVKRAISSPLRLWRKLKNAYINMMLNLGGGSNSINTFGDKRIPKARQLPISYSTTEFHNRLVLEIYKSLVASRELATI